MTIDGLVAAIFCGLLLSVITMALVSAVVISKRASREEDEYWAEFSRECQKDVNSDR